MWLNRPAPFFLILMETVLWSKGVYYNDEAHKGSRFTRGVFSSTYKILLLLIYNHKSQIGFFTANIFYIYVCPSDC